MFTRRESPGLLSCSTWAWLALALLLQQAVSHADAAPAITALSARGPSTLARPNAANALDVTLNIGGSASAGGTIAAFCCSNTGTCTSGFTDLSGAQGQWALAGSKANGQEAWRLEAGLDGPRDVYCWLRDDAGVTSAVKHIQVLLDTQRPGEPAVPFNNCTSAATGNATLSASVDERGTHIGVCCSSNPDFQADCAGRVAWLAGPTQDADGYPLGAGEARAFDVECPFEVAPQGMLAADGSTRDVNIFLVDGAGNWAPYTLALEVDRVPPTATLVAVNGGVSDKANTSKLVLSIAASDRNGVARMCVTEDKAACRDAGSWQRFQATSDFQLLVSSDNADGANRTVYVYLKDRCGARTPQPAVASIILDSTPPKVTVELKTAGNDTWCTSEAALPVTIHATDGGEGPMSLCVQGTDEAALCAWEDIGSGDVTVTRTHTLAVKGENYIYIRLADGPGGQGNRRLVVRGMTLNPVPPAGGVLSVNDGAPLTSDLNVKVAVTGADGLWWGVAQMCFTTNLGNCTKWQASGDHAAPLHLPDSHDGMTHTVYAYLRTACGATTTVPLSANITYSTGHPGTPTVEIIQGRVRRPAAVPLMGVELAVTLPALTGAYTPEMCVSNTPSCTASFEPYAPSKLWNITNEGVCTVYVWLRDPLKRVSLAGQAVVNHNITSALLALAVNQSEVTSNASVLLLATSCNATVDMCVTDRPVKDGRHCPKWEAYKQDPTIKLTGEGQRNITAYFRRGKTDELWGPATATVHYDKTPPKMSKQAIELAGAAVSGANYVLTFNAKADDGEPKGSGVSDYLLVWSKGSTPPSKCGGGAQPLKVALGPDGRGNASLTGVPWAQLAERYHFRLCARDRVGNVSPGIVFVPDKSKPPPECIQALATPQTAGAPSFCVR